MLKSYFVGFAIVAMSWSHIALADASNILFERPAWLESSDLSSTGTTEISIGNKSSKSYMKRVTEQELPAIIPDGNIEDFKIALKRQIKRCRRYTSNKTWKFGDRVVTRKQWCIETAGAFLKLAIEKGNMEEVWSYAKTHYEWYKSEGKDQKGKVHYTGYYLPLLRGSRVQAGIYTYPLYKKPGDLVRTLINGSWRWRRELPDGSYTPYYDRKEIDWDFALQGQDLEIVYVDDMIEAFFLHIQGSGIVEVTEADGSKNRIFVNYAAQNGQPYVAIGRVLKKEGVDKKYLTLQGLRRYFTEKPSEIDRIFPKNPSYVFFNEAQNGPFGSGSTVLVGGHSIATDNKIFPLGAIALISTKRPIIENGEITDWKDFSRLMVNQDTGGAIKGAGRVDIYWGEGLNAELAAGSQNHNGTLYFAVIPTP